MYPSSFSRQLDIEGLPTSGAAEIIISIIHGRLIRQEVMNTHKHTIELNVSSGQRQVLLVEIRSGDFRMIRKVVQL